MAYPWDVAHDVAHDTLDRIGCPGSRFKNTAYDRVTLAGDRLMMRPVGEPDTADLVGRINEICDRAGISDGEAAWRVTLLFGKLENLMHDEKLLRHELRKVVESESIARVKLAEARADLEAERAQLDAKPQKPVATPGVTLALGLLFEQSEDTKMRHVYHVLREAFA